MILFGMIGACSVVAQEHYDVVFWGGQVMDGTGTPAYRADVGIVGARIASIGDLSGADADRFVDVSDKIVVPGFIDLHSHADGPDDNEGLRSRNLKRRAAPNLVTQGITTVVVNQDGRSPLDLRRQRAQLDERGMGPNAVLMVGHNTLRRAAFQGHSYKQPATPDEIGQMITMLKAGMDAGGYGLSAGLEYEPGIWSTTDELVSLVKEIVPYAGVYIIHERSSGVDPMWTVPSQDGAAQPTMLDSVMETIEIGERTGATVVATHIKARGTEYWGKSGDIIHAIESARERGIRIYADQYPYTSSGSDGTIALIPYWVLDSFQGESTDYAGALMAVLKDSSRAAILRDDVAHAIERRGGADRIVVFGHPDQKVVGKTLAELAAARELSPVETVYLLQLEGFRNRFGGAVLRGFSMSQKDVDTFAAQPWVATASDAGIALRDDGLVHARYYGTFPRKIRDLALNRGVLSLEQAIHSMTGLPGEILGFGDRGQLREGYVADLVVLDLTMVRDAASYMRPHHFAEGIPYVMVNGIFVVDAHFLTYRTPGVVITPPPPQLRHNTDD
jgi:N-acyl-D-amino-acid deacylase